MNLLDALRTSFSHRSLHARSMGKKDTVSDAAVASITFLKVSCRLKVAVVWLIGRGKKSFTQFFFFFTRVMSRQCPLPMTCALKSLCAKQPESARVKQAARVPYTANSEREFFHQQTLDIRARFFFFYVFIKFPNVCFQVRNQLFIAKNEQCAF